MAQVCNLTKLYQNNFVLFYFLTIYKCHPAFLGKKYVFQHADIEKYFYMPLINEYICFLENFIRFLF